MRMMLTRAVLVVVFLLVATSGFAQSAYVSAAVGMDVSRLSNVEVTHVQNLHHGGEATAVSLRAGTRIGQNWGIEIGFTRPSPVEMEREFGFRVSLVSVPGADLTSSLSALETRNHYERRDETLDTAVWIAQPIANRLDLVYLGGVAFNRTIEEIRYEVTRRVGSAVVPVGARSTIYALTPVLGLDARIALTEHIRLVPGVRLQGIGPGASGTAGWLIRPSAGLMWEF